MNKFNGYIDLLCPKSTYRYTEMYIHRDQNTHIRAMGHLNAAIRRRNTPK
jgi:hypothetical protein